jgi:hypothetical protein
MKMKYNSCDKLSIKTITINLLVFFVLGAVAGCKKFVEVTTPPNQIVSSLIFTNDATATSAVTGIYSQMVGSGVSFMNGAMTVYPGLSSDEIVNTTANVTLDPFTSNTLANNNSTVQTIMWKASYSLIYDANACIEGLNKSSGITPALKKQLLGEAKFIRALNYFYLVNLFGDVPLITGTDYTVNEIVPCTSTSKVYDQMIADLVDAQQLLLTTYPTVGPVRANKWAATALLARLYLYHKDWALAEAQATAVINSGTYNLVPGLNQVFLAGSKEAILQFIPAPGNNTSEGLTFIPSSNTVRPTYALTTTLVAAFEVNDNRKTSWVANNVITGITYNYPYKYKVRSGTVITENYMVLRLAEQYLIRAEARYNLERVPDAVADLNVIRARAFAPASAGPLPANAVLPTTLSPGQCIDAIVHERQVELFAEWGQRWFDLKRTGRIDAVLSASKPAWQPFQALYPIPYVEIQRNPALTQNIGYPK